MTSSQAYSRGESFTRLPWVGLYGYLGKSKEAVTDAEKAGLFNALGCGGG